MLSLQAFRSAHPSPAGRLICEDQFVTAGEAMQLPIVGRLARVNIGALVHLKRPIMSVLVPVHVEEIWLHLVQRMVEQLRVRELLSIIPRLRGREVRVG